MDQVANVPHQKLGYRREVGARSAAVRNRPEPAASGIHVRLEARILVRQRVPTETDRLIREHIGGIPTS